MAPSNPPDSIRILVPGTVSNLGPGFDCLGAALNIQGVVELCPGREPEDVHPMAEEAASAFFGQPELASRQRLSFDWSIGGGVPRSRGLGSSVVLRLGILAGLNIATGGPLSRNRLFEVCSDLEGHPDNAGPAVFGGFFVAGPNGAPVSFALDAKLRFVLLIRKHEVLTDEARKVLPRQIGFAEAVANVGRAAAMTGCFASGQYGKLRGLFRDYLHEPYREEVNPRLAAIIAAGETAGALGGFLSGSGSTVACLVDQPAVARQVGDAMVAACQDAEAPELRLVAPDNTGFVSEPAR